MAAIWFIGHGNLYDQACRARRKRGDAAFETLRQAPSLPRTFPAAWAREWLGPGAARALVMQTSGPDTSVHLGAERPPPKVAYVSLLPWVSGAVI